MTIQINITYWEPILKYHFNPPYYDAYIFRKNNLSREKKGQGRKLSVLSSTKSRFTKTDGAKQQQVCQGTATSSDRSLRSSVTTASTVRAVGMDSLLSHNWALRFLFHAKGSKNKKNTVFFLCLST